MLYSWGPESAITKAVINPLEKGACEAVLHVGADAPAGSLASVAAQLREQGHEVSPDVRGSADGGVEHVLRVRGTFTEQALLGQLNEQGVLGAEPKVAPVPKAPKPKMTLSQRFRDRSLQVAGGLYLVGDVLLIGSGYLRTRNDPYKKGGGLAEAGVGVAFGISDVMLAMYGRKNANRVRRGLVGEGAEYLKADGAAFTHDGAITDDSNKRTGFLSKVDDFLYKQLIPVKSVFEIIGGGLYVKAGKAQGNPWKAGSGLSIISGFVASLVVPEKAPHELRAGGPKPEGLLGKLFADGPMKFTGGMALLNNALLMTGAVSEHKQYASREANLLNKQREAVHAFNTGAAGVRIENADSPDPAVVSNLSEKFCDVQNSIGKLEALRTTDRALKIKNINLGTPYVLNGIAAAFLASANVLLMLSKKNQDDVAGSKEYDDIYTLPALAYLELPPEQRQQKIDGYSGYMANKLKFSRSAEEISASIMEKVAALESSPFLPQMQPALTAAERDMPQIIEQAPPLPDLPRHEAAPEIRAEREAEGIIEYGPPVPEGILQHAKPASDKLDPKEFQTVAKPAPAPASWSERSVTEPSASPSLPL